MIWKIKNMIAGMYWFLITPKQSFMSSMATGTIFPTSSAITSPTPDFVNTAPRLASSIGNILSGPTTDSSQDESSRNTFGVFLRE